MREMLLLFYTCHKTWIEYWCDAFKKTAVNIWWVRQKNSDPSVKVILVFLVFHALFMYCKNMTCPNSTLDVCLAFRGGALYTWYQFVWDYTSDIRGWYINQQRRSHLTVEQETWLKHSLHISLQNSTCKLQISPPASLQWPRVQVKAEP